MTRRPLTGGSETHAATCDAAVRVQLRQWLQADALDAAIDAGLMTYAPCAACDAATLAAAQDTACIVATQQRLASAWAARQRYRERTARLARRAAQREARRKPAQATAQATASLPPAAAAILARVKAMTAGKA